MKRILLLPGILVTSFCSFADIVQDPCSGPTALLNIINRPTNADSSCVVSSGKLFIESGFQYQELLDSNGTQLNLPNIALRSGLPAKTEFVILLPNDIHQSVAPCEGASATSLGVKHQFGYNEKWIFASSGYLTPPSGSAAFGSAGTGMSINGIISYSINNKLGFTGMLGASTQTQSIRDGQGRYSSINPDMVLTLAPKDQLNLYAEVYGQSQTAPDQGWGWNSDFGVLYLLNPAVVLDLEAGKRLSGALGGFEQYIGAGISVMLE